jgi:cell division protein FtsI (penicillin-binding protein 3)
MSKKRAVILHTAIVASFILISLRLADLMIFDHKRLQARAQQQHIKVEDVQVRRGMILDRRGRELALNLEVESLYCDPEALKTHSEKMRKLASFVDIHPTRMLARIPDEGRFAWIKRKLPPQTAEQIRALRIEGLDFITEAKRFYPKRELASHIIGFVGIDNQALEGVELQYDKYLTPKGGKILLERDASGKTLSSGVTVEAKGNTIVLTIDEVLQRVVEKELDRAMKQWKAAAASAIMMDPYTGDILALASRPAYDVNEGGNARPSARRNRAITDCYEPGSTFKLVIGVGGLEERRVRPDTLFDVGKGSIQVGGKTIHDVHKYDVITFKEVIQKSSNVGSIMAGMRLGKENIYRYAKLLGFGERTGIDLPGEVSGWIMKPEQWSGTSIGAISIGQEVAVTPLQMLRAYSAIANGGLLVRPHIVSEIISPENRVIASFRNSENHRVVSEKTANTFRDILKSVTEEGGTATSASIDGNLVAGKTGTAQMIDPVTKRYSRDMYVSSFVGFVPADAPRFAMIVIVYKPKGAIYGGVVAAPVFREIVRQALSYLNVPREDSLGQRALLVSR